MHRDPAAPLTHRRSRTLNPFKTRAFAAAAAGFADIAAAHAPKPPRQQALLPPPTARQASAPLPRAVAQRSPVRAQALSWSAAVCRSFCMDPCAKSEKPVRMAVSCAQCFLA